MSTDNCARCGCDAQLVWNPYREDAGDMPHEVKCLNCGNSSGFYWSEAAARDFWNVMQRVRRIRREYPHFRDVIAAQARQGANHE